MRFVTLSDDEVHAGFRDLVIEERERLALQLDYLAELDRRKLFFHYASLRALLVDEYGLEEWRAERMIRAARLLRRLPELRDRIESGALNLSLMELALDCAHRVKFSDDEISSLLHDLAGKSVRQARREIAARYPHGLALPKDRVRPYNEDYSEVRWMASHETLDRLEEVRGLLAHRHPGASLDEIIGELAGEYLRRHHPEEKARRGQGDPAKASDPVKTPATPRVRAPGAAIVRALTRTQGYRCAYRDPLTQKRCESRQGLEIDHILPWSSGGSTELSNLRYLCPGHHRRVSFALFGGASRFRK